MMIRIDRMNVQMFRALIRTNSIFSLTRRYMSSNSNVKEISNPSLYASYSNIATLKTASDVIEEFPDNLRNIRGKCMDIGCGPGNITNNILSFLDKNAKMIGADISQEMLEYAKKHYSIEGRLEFEILDIQTKELPKKYVSEFDHIFSFYTFHWCNDIRQIFENIHRMLRPNGTALILFIAKHDFFDVFENLVHDIRYASYIPNVTKIVAPYQHSVNPRKEFTELLQKLGFKVVHCSLRDAYLADEEETEWSMDKCTDAILANFLKFRDETPDDLKEDFKKDFLQRLMEKKIIYKREKKRKGQCIRITQIINSLYAESVMYSYTQ